MTPGFYLDGEEGTLTLDKESLMTTLVRDVRTGDFVLDFSLQRKIFLYTKGVQ